MSAFTHTKLCVYILLCLLNINNNIPFFMDLTSLSVESAFQHPNSRTSASTFTYMHLPISRLVNVYPPLYRLTCICQHPHSAHLPIFRLTHNCQHHHSCAPATSSFKYTTTTTAVVGQAHIAPTQMIPTFKYYLPTSSPTCTCEHPH